MENFAIFESLLNKNVSMKWSTGNSWILRAVYKDGANFDRAVLENSKTKKVFVGFAKDIVIPKAA